MIGQYLLVRVALLCSVPFCLNYLLFYMIIYFVLSQIKKCITCTSGPSKGGGEGVYACTVHTHVFFWPHQEKRGSYYIIWLSFFFVVLLACADPIDRWFWTILLGVLCFFQTRYNCRGKSHVKSKLNVRARKKVIIMKKQNSSLWDVPKTEAGSGHSCDLHDDWGTIRNTRLNHDYVKYQQRAGELSCLLCSPICSSVNHPSYSVVGRGGTRSLLITHTIHTELSCRNGAMC